MKFVLNLAWLSLATCATIRSPQPVSYDGYQVHRLRYTGSQYASTKRALASIPHETLNEVRGTWDVLIAPEQLDAFNALGLKTRTLHENLADSIARESYVKKAWKRQSNGSEDAWFDSYHPYEDHISWWRDLQESFPEHSNWTSTGTSYEGRDMFGVHLWGAGGPGKPAVIYHGTVHAREWITAPVIEYIAKQLVDGYKAGDNDTQAVLDNYDFYMFPFVNPDGFVFSQTDNRLWRKNRQPPPENAANQTCFGRDVNRNWETNWDADPRGASPDPCSQTYRGEAPRDTPENQGMDNLIRKIRDEQGIKLYIDWHSYSQLILYPFGHKETLYAPELGMWTKAAALMSDTIRYYSTNATTEPYISSSNVNSPARDDCIDQILDGEATTPSSKPSQESALMEEPHTPMKERNPVLWHGLPSPNTPTFRSDMHSTPSAGCAEEELVWQTTREQTKDAVDQPSLLIQHCSDTGKKEAEDVNTARSPAVEDAAQNDAILARELERSINPTKARRSTRLRTQAKPIYTVQLPATDPKTARKSPSSPATPDRDKHADFSIVPIESDPVPFEGLPTVHSLSWQLQYPPGGSTHPSYPYPTMDPRLLFHQAFVPVVGGLPDFTLVPKLVLPMGWKHVSWSGLLPIAFDPYRQAFKLTPVGAIPLTCEELQQQGLQKYVPGGELHPEFGLLPEMLKLSDGSDAEREAQDCPNKVFDVSDAWRWLSEKETNHTADFIPTPEKKWHGSGAFRSTRKLKSPIPELMMLSMLSDPTTPNIELNPLLQNQDSTKDKNQFCPFKSVATPCTHYYWGHAAERMAKAGVTGSMIREFLIMTRGLQGDEVMKSGSISCAAMAARKRDCVKLEEVEEMDIDEVGKDTPTPSPALKSSVIDMTTNHTAEGWVYDVWEKIDYPLLALAHGLQSLPTGPDAGPLTALILWCREKGQYRALLSEVSTLLRAADIEPLIESGDDGCPDREFAGRHAASLKKDRLRVVRDAGVNKRALSGG
ncbi:hypothetical protein GT037_002999, partial [Alternaria burnsii]